MTVSAGKGAVGSGAQPYSSFDVQGSAEIGLGCSDILLVFLTCVCVSFSLFQTLTKYVILVSAPMLHLGRNTRCRICGLRSASTQFKKKCSVSEFDV